MQAIFRQVFPLLVLAMLAGCAGGQMQADDDAMNDAADPPPGYLAAPQGEPVGSVLVLHAWWGLNDTTKRVCDRLAGAGYLAFAPDLYHGQVTSDIAEAETLSGALDPERARADVAAGLRHLLARSGRDEVAVIGFSLGAYFALDLSAAEPERVRAVVLYYGTGPADFSRARATYLGNFAEDDPYEPQAQVAELEADLRAAGRPVQFHHYPGTGHWFAEPDRADAYDAPAAELAWRRTMTFLDEQVRRE